MGPSIQSRLGPAAARLGAYSQNVRVCLAVLILATTVSACGSGNGGRRAEMSSSARPLSAANRRVERCIDRLMQHANTEGVPDSQSLRRYVRRAYCGRFEKKGWVYEDGALRIAAQTWLDHGGTCASGGEGEPARTVPCEPERRGGVQIIECALLRVIRRSEVIDYIEQLRKQRPVECDDGTAIGDLGVPQAGDSGEDPTGAPNPPEYTCPAPTTTVEGWREPGTSG